MFSISSNSPRSTIRTTRSDRAGEQPLAAQAEPVAAVPATVQAPSSTHRLWQTRPWLLLSWICVAAVFVVTVAVGTNAVEPTHGPAPVAMAHEWCTPC